MKKNNTIFYIIGAVILVLALSQLPLIPWFALVTTTVCAPGVTNYYPLDGVLTDLKGGPDITNNGASFIAGKLGSGALEFNNTDSISFPTLPLNLSVGFWINNYSNEEGWIYKTYDNTSILSSTTFLGLIGSVDEIVVGENITSLFSTIQPCYLTVTQENITCKNYATEQVTDPSSGCLNYSGDFFPNCTYELVNISQYHIEGDECIKYFYCQNPCLNTTNCYLTNQNCIENLGYDCYIIEDNKCTPKIDYTSCTGTDYYSNLTECRANLTIETTTPSGTDPTTTSPKETIGDKLNKKIFTIAGYNITLLHLLILLIVVIAVLYFLGAFGKKK